MIATLNSVMNTISKTGDGCFYGALLFQCSFEQFAELNYRLKGNAKIVRDVILETCAKD